LKGRKERKTKIKEQQNKNVILIKRKAEIDKTAMKSRNY
jgi:hypothetical protein